MRRAPLWIVILAIFTLVLVVIGRLAAVTPEGLARLSPGAVGVTAVKQAALVGDVDGDGQADPGDTLQYSVVISANGLAAQDVTLTDALDPNTAFVPGSLKTTPIARNDADYTAIGNVGISVPTPGLLANDSDADGGVLTAGAGTTSAQGGNVAVNSDGSFTYTPRRASLAQIPSPTP